MSPEQLAEIRNLYRTGQTEPQHVAALLNELDRLRAMVPRLEWRGYGSPYFAPSDLRLWVVVGNMSKLVLVVSKDQHDLWLVVEAVESHGPSQVDMADSAESMRAAVTKWASAMFPGVPLPPFPGADNA